MYRYLTFCLITFVLSGLSFSATINIPADYPTIQQGIDAAVNGDTVLVAPGTYFENIDFKGKAVTVSSEQGVDVTVIDGNQAGSVVTCKSGEDEYSALNGFTITNGSGTYHNGDKCGGGMFIHYSSPMVTNCFFSDNYAYYGGGMCNCDSNCTMVANCSFSENTGHGICNRSSSPTVVNCIFMKNNGPGMFNFYSDPLVINCSFNKNHTIGSGGGISDFRSFPIVFNCTFIENSANYGGAMASGDFCGPEIVNCTFSRNKASIKGGAIYLFSDGNVINCICWDDEPDEIYNEISYGSISYSCIQGGYSGPGNINTDPLFVDPANGDFHLTNPSDCIDSGDNSAVTEPCDFEGDPRIAYGTVDMGADEFHRHLYWTGDATPGGNVDLKFIDTPNTSPLILWLGSGIMNPPVHLVKYGNWYLQFPLLLEGQFGSIPGPDGVLYLPFTIPSNIPTPLTLPMQALSGSKLTNLSVMEIK